MIFEERFSESLSLVDAVMPDVVLARQQQLREKVAAHKQQQEQEKKSLQRNAEESLNNVDVHMISPEGGDVMTSSTTNAALAMSQSTTTANNSDHVTNSSSITSATSTLIKQEPQMNGDSGNTNGLGRLCLWMESLRLAKYRYADQS